MMRCYWGLRRHPAETALQWMGQYRPCCYQHRAMVELSKVEARLLARQFERSMGRVLDVINTPAEKIDRWAQSILSHKR
jgi:hypothetical protein